ncbi:hypothetical protein ACH4TV_23575 [Streptomyces sp. NPDC020898]|uniref:hypothetical protein n=1 Tax=Streptomyces sp. NPDC020898 TaxID=3365101 RepID=UPI00379A6791
MARRTNTSCTGMAVRGYLLLTLWSAVGSLLVLPFTVVDLMASQEPPLQLRGFGQHALVYGAPVAAAAGVAAFMGRIRRAPGWVFPARTAVVLALSQAAVVGAEARFDSPDWHSRALALGGAAGLTAFLCPLALRWWHNGGLNGGRRRPDAGEIWHAVVPFRESDGELPHYCVVMRARFRHVEVLQITSQNKDSRDDHIGMPNDGWDFSSGKDHWVEIGLPPRLVPYGKFTETRPKGPCPKYVWRQLRANRPKSVASGMPTLRTRITQYFG